MAPSGRPELLPVPAAAPVLAAPAPAVEPLLIAPLAAVAADRSPGVPELAAADRDADVVTLAAPREVLLEPVADADAGVVVLAPAEPASAFVESVDDVGPLPSPDWPAGVPIPSAPGRFVVGDGAASGAGEDCAPPAPEAGSTAAAPPATAFVREPSELDPAAWPPSAA